MTLTSVTPYTVPWKDVAIHVCHKTVEKTQILYSINGSLVALCQADLTHVCINVCGHTRFTKLRSQCTEN
jgi:polynucleotide 5'-hydroxyl-kinase GRC3/NOL9